MPISEFHVAFCGIATVAATLGYACARRAAVSLASSPASSKPDVEAGASEERSLKRKLDDSDQLDVDTDTHSRPVKRNRTPPADKYQLDDDDWEVIVAPPSYEQAVGLRLPEESVQVKDTPSQGNPSSVEQQTTPAREPTLPPQLHPGTLSQPDEKEEEARRSPTPPPQVDPSPSEPETPPAPPVTPPKPTDAFSAFSGSGSPFASYSNPSGSSPFTVSGQNAKTTPAWRRVNNISEPDVFGQASSANALALSPNDAVSSTTTLSPESKDALGASNEVKPFVKSSTCLTGEEDEIVEAELKGVKLFTKRGRKEFTDGMYGHVKLLSQKSAPRKISDEEESRGTENETKSRTRLLFRRDPLGQVSMNVGLRSTVRCHLDAAENILRVILMEQATTDGKNSKEDVVVYALKPGRAGKADFQTFARTLCDYEGLQSRVVASSTVATGEVAAS